MAIGDRMHDNWIKKELKWVEAQKWLDSDFDQKEICENVYHEFVMEKIRVDQALKILEFHKSRIIDSDVKEAIHSTITSVLAEQELRESLLKPEKSRGDN